MTQAEIITSDKFCSLAHNYISKKKIHVEITPEKNIFFIKTDCIDFFRSFILPKINYKFTLITHESDCSINESHIDILNCPLLLTWFGMNCHIIHEKLQPIPIGVANEEWPHGNKGTIASASQKQIEKTGLVYCNFDFNTNLQAREEAYEILKQKDFITFDFTRKTFQEYLHILKSYKYVISPPGNSIDCHRIWESIYIGTVPICLKSIPLLYFKDQPILFVNDWENINQELLQSNYDFLASRGKVKSTFSYYKNLIQEA